MELSAMSILNTVCGPHYLLSTRIWQYNSLEQLRTRIVRLEGTMIGWMPVPCSEHILELFLLGTLPQLIDNWEDLFVVGHAE